MRLLPVRPMIAPKPILHVLEQVSRRFLLASFVAPVTATPITTSNENAVKPTAMATTSVGDTPRLSSAIAIARTLPLPYHDGRRLGSPSISRKCARSGGTTSTTTTAATE